MDIFGLLPEDYPLFTWDDYQQSYNALINRSNTSEFQKAAWNGIVDTLHNALTDAGLTWSDRYTSYEGARMATDSAYSALSAAMFNSVRYNVDQYFTLTWPWKRSETYHGYIGRTDFVGVADGGVPDAVYANYILTLVERLNFLIEILKDTAQMPFLDSLTQVNTGTDAALRASVAKRLFAEQIPSSINIGTVVAPYALRHYAAILDKCLTDADLRTPEAARMKIEFISQCSRGVVLERPGAGQLASGFISHYVRNADLAAPWASRLDAPVVSRYIRDAELAAPRTSWLTVEHICAERHDAALLTPWAQRLFAGEISAACIHSPLHTPWATRMLAGYTSHEHSDVNMASTPAKHYAAQHTSTGGTDAYITMPTAANIQSGYAFGYTEALATLEAVLSDILRKFFSGWAQVFSSQHSGIALCGPVALGSFAEPVFSEHSAGLNGIRAVKLGRAEAARASSSTGHVELKRIIGLGKWGEIYRTSHAAKLGISRTANLGRYEEKLFTSHYGDFWAFRGIILGQWSDIFYSSHKGEVVKPQAQGLGKWSGIYYSSHNGTMATLPPMGVTGDEVAYSSHKGEATLQATKPLGGAGVAQTDQAAVLEANCMVTFDGRCQVQTSVNATLDFAWLPPIWVDGALYIRQVYDATQTNDELEVM